MKRLLFVLAMMMGLSVCCSDTERPREVAEIRKVVPYAPREAAEIRKVVPHSPREDAAMEELELELRKFIFQDELAIPNPVREKRDEIVYLSFGWNEVGDWIEPPEGFVERFSDLSIIVRPVSDAKLIMGPQISKTDGRVGCIHYVQIVEWLDENRVRVNRGWYRGPLSAVLVSGAIYRHSDGAWQLEADGARVIS